MVWQSRGTVLLVVGVLAVAGTAGAVPAPRDHPIDTTPPVRVFVGETLNVSTVDLTGGGSIGTARTTLIGESGAADGELVEISDPTAADFSDVTPGTYYVNDDSDDKIEFAVTEPRVTSVTIRNQNGANVTDAWEPTGEDLTVTAQYNFDAADRLDVTIHDSSGFDITNEVATESHITTSGGSIQVDLSSEPDGTYRITVTGSALEEASRTVTVRTGSRETATKTATTGTTTASVSTTTTTQPPTATTTALPTTSETVTASTTTTEATSVSPPSTPTSTSTTIPGFGPIVTCLGALAGISILLRDN